jgi:hypothetical protein
MGSNNISACDARQVTSERHTDTLTYLRRSRGAAAKEFTDESLLKNARRRPTSETPQRDRLWSTVLFTAFMPSLIYAFLIPVLDGALVGFVGQLTLSLSVVFSLRLLKSYPLINPIHAVLLFFQWWFGWAPAVCAAYWFWQGDSASARAYTVNGITPVLIVSLGLPLYAGAARWVLTNWKGPQLASAAPRQASYKIGSVLRLCLAAAVAWLILLVFEKFGIRAYETLNFLGGQQTLTWWLMPFVECEQLLDLAAVACCSFLATSDGKIDRKQKIVALAVIAFATARVLTSGSKGAIVKPAFYFILAFVNWKRRVPWLGFVFLLFGYLLLVEPYVDGMRVLSERVGATTSEQRTEIFRAGLLNMVEHRNLEVHPDVESIFRFIYPYTQQVIKQSTLISGPWEGKTILDGLSSVVPRAILSTKADTNTGNFFARELKGISEDNTENIPITIPFEVVGNFGWLAGILSFVVIGVLWAAFVAWALTVERMTTHPLTPFMIGAAMIMEQSVGQALSALKVLALILVLLNLVVRMPNRKLVVW